MNRAQIEDKLHHIIAQALDTELTEKDIPTGPGLLEQLHIDSLIALQIIVQIEQQFNVTIDDDELALEMLDSLDKAVTYIEQFGERQGALLGDN